MMMRGIALCLAALMLLNVIVGALSHRFDANHWWFDLRPLPNLPASLLLGTAAAFILSWAIAPTMALWRRRATLASLGLLSLISLCNATTFYLLLARGKIVSLLPLPLSLAIATLLLLIARDVRHKRNVSVSSRNAMFAATGIATLLCVPLAQIIFFGNTDYRRPADVAVVFGARAYADGTASQALADRVRTGCELYRMGLVHKLIFSGGPGDGAVHETDAMRTMALRLGVPDEAIVLDPAGVNTAATVANTIHMVDLRHQRVLAVSHFYHLPRIKLEYERAGVAVYTVPAPQERTLRRLPFLVVREMAALWAYYCHLPN